MTACEKRESQRDIARAKDEVLQAARDYTQLKKSGDLIKAEERYWDFAEFAKRVFGVELQDYSAETREEVCQKFREFFRKIEAVPEVRDILRAATMDDFQVEGPDDGKYTVRFVAAYAGRKIPNRLLFRRINDKWRIVDSASGPGEGRFLGEQTRQFYQEERGKKTPLEFISDLVEHTDKTNLSERIQSQMGEAEARAERSARVDIKPRIEKAPADKAQPTTETAVEAARRYSALMKGAEPIKAVETFWEIPEMLETMFGGRLVNTSQAERDEMKRLLLEFLRGIYANPQIAEAMNRTTFEDFQSKAAQDGKTMVSFTARIDDQRLLNVVVFKQIDGLWKIVDAGANNQPLMVETFAREYKKHADRLTPEEFLKLMTAP
jgi:hypothetical protein